MLSTIRLNGADASIAVRGPRPGPDEGIAAVETTGFRHINVVPADDEIVIEAGARTQAAPVAEPEPVTPVAEPAPEPFMEPAVAEAVTAEALADAKAEADLAAAESGLSNFSRALHSAIAEERVGKPAREVYRETTLEDLEGTPMSGLQKVVLFGLLGILVLFGVYCALHFGAHLL